MRPGAAVGETAVEMLQSGPDSGVFEGMKGAGHVVRGSRVTSLPSGPWSWGRAHISPPCMWDAGRLVRVPLQELR